MRIHRLYTDQPLEPGRETTLGDGPAHYLGRVLRAARGQSVVLFNGDGHDYPADVIRLSKTEVVLDVRSRLPAAAPTSSTDAAASLARAAMSSSSAASPPDMSLLVLALAWSRHLIGTAAPADGAAVTFGRSPRRRGDVR